MSNDITFSEGFLFSGKDLFLDKNVIVKHPSIENILSITNDETSFDIYWNMVNTLMCDPYTHMVMLDDLGIDFTKISDIEFFSTMIHGISKDATDLIFDGTIDLSKFMLDKREDETILYDTGSDIIIDAEILKKISRCLCIIHGIKKERFTPAGRMAKQMMILADRDEKKIKTNQDKKSSSFLSIISSAINCPGYKYNREQTLGLNMYFFIDCIERIKLNYAVDGLTIGWYTGSLDPKKFNPDERLNRMGDLHK